MEKEASTLKKDKKSKMKKRIKKLKKKMKKLKPANQNETTRNNTSNK